MEEETEKINVLAPKKCLNCGEVNSVEMLYCGKCGFVLSEKEAENMIAEKKIMDRMKLFFIEKMQTEEQLEKQLPKEEKNLVASKDRLLKEIIKDSVEHLDHNK